jgi:hypothetical protein
MFELIDDQFVPATAMFGCQRTRMNDALKSHDRMRISCLYTGINPQT